MWNGGRKGAAKGELTDGPLDMESDPCHFFKRIDICDPDRASAKSHPGGHEVKHLSEDAGILENKRIRDRAVFPRNPAKPGGNHDQDLGRGSHAHRGCGLRQERFDIASGSLDWRQGVVAGIVMIKTGSKSFADVNGKIALKLGTGARRREGPRDGLRATRAWQCANGAIQKA